MNERLNIRRMQMPEQVDHSDLLFDSKREVTQRDRERVTQAVMSNLSTFQIAEMTANMKILGIDLPANTKERVPTNAEMIFSHGNAWNETLRHAAYARIVFPEAEPIKGAAWGATDRYIERLKKVDAYIGQVAQMASNIKIVAPEHGDTHVVPEDWEKFDVFAKSYFDQRSRSYANLAEFIDFLAALRVLDPTRAVFDYVTTDQWKLAREYMQYERQHFDKGSADDPFRPFLRVAAGLEIISADAVKVGREEGLEIIRRKRNVSDSVSPVPVTSEI
jgi:hypothetical protein